MFPACSIGKTVMWKTNITLLCGLALFGCDTFGRVKVDNPVMGPPPPRMAAAEPAAQADDLTPRQFGEDDPQGISLASVSRPAAGEELGGSQVVATVNGTPIFDSEVLERYSRQLNQAARDLPPEELQKLRMGLIQRDLQVHIDRKLLVQTLRATLTKDQLELLDTHLDQLFEAEIDRLKEESGVNTRHEVEARLAEQGTSLESLRDTFVNQRMAIDYLAAKSKHVAEIGRPDMLRYYDEHAEDYFVPGEVKWQQIVIRFDKNGGQAGALAELEQAIDELRAGADFAEVAKKYSDGATAEDGGNWDWTQRGSLADERAEKALFELPVGTISQVFANEDQYQLVKVVARREPRQIPFAKVQNEIKEKLFKQKRTEATQKVLAELHAGAVVETIFD